jgi:hypothetical protein
MCQYFGVLERWNPLSFPFHLSLFSPPSGVSSLLGKCVPLPINWSFLPFEKLVGARGNYCNAIICITLELNKEEFGGPLWVVSLCRCSLLITYVVLEVTVD